MNWRTHSLPAVLACVLLGGTAGAAEPLLEKTDLFEAGTEGYVLYRIPGLVVTAKGTILAYCEARRHSGNDWDAIDVLLRRSSDAGKTWSARQKIAQVEGPIKKNPAALAKKVGKAEDVTYNNAVAIVDAQTGAVHFLFCVEYNRCFYQRSDDDGQTFSKPVEITATLDEFRKEYDWKAFGTGPGHGIQLKSGRLVVPVWMSTGAGDNAHHPSLVVTIYSDDHGKTWKRGTVVANETDPLINPNETVLVQLADGPVLLNMRNESKENRRAVALSADGATGWSKPVFDDQLYEPVCMASICRLSEKGPRDRNRIVFANPHNLERASGKAIPGGQRDRKNLTVKLTYDECKTWPVARTLEAGTSAYSDLAVGRDGTIYCLYERGSMDGNHFRTKYLTLARFNLEWLSDGKDRLGEGAKP
jgi:sialidase-1